MTLAQLIFAAILYMFPNANHRACLQERRTTIENNAEDAANRNGVPVGVLIVAGWMESHMGCDPASGGCWGAPIDPQHRHTAGTPNHAAVALATSYRVCHSWEGAISRFRCGLCTCPPRYNAYVQTSVNLVARLYARVNHAAPPDLRRAVTRR